MGPKLESGEAVSHFRFRCAAYSLKWLVLLGVPLLLLFWIRPSINESSIPFLLTFVYIGLPILCATAVVAAIGYCIGAFWAAILERCPAVAAIWPSIRLAILMLLLSPIPMFSSYMILRGITTERVLVFSISRRGPMRYVNWSEDAEFFMFNIAIWGLLTLLSVVLYYIGIRVILEKKWERH